MTETLSFPHTALPPFFAAPLSCREDERSGLLRGFDRCVTKLGAGQRRSAPRSVIFLGPSLIIIKGDHCSWVGGSVSPAQKKKKKRPALPFSLCHTGPP